MGTASAKEARSAGYPTLLPGTVVTPAQKEPFWYDDSDPTELWDAHLSKVTKHTVVQPIQLKTAAGDASIPKKAANTLRFLCMSDTHNFHSKLPLPAAELGVDVLLHAGDFSNVGDGPDVEAFTKWLREVPIKYKVMIAGNHDMSFDAENYAKTLARRFQHRVVLDPAKLKRDLVAGYQVPVSTAADPFPSFEGGVAYLEDSGLSIEGVRIWGSPWQPEFHAWGFNLPRGQPCREKWYQIPTATQVLMTHGPPVGHGDLCKPGNNRAGCVDLLMEIATRIKPAYHVFGHIHEGYGQTTDGTTQFVNPSNCNDKYDSSNLNPSIIFDMPLAAGRSAAAPAAASSNMEE